MEITKPEAAELYRLVSIAKMKAEDRAFAGEQGLLDKDPERSEVEGRRWQGVVDNAEKWLARLGKYSLGETGGTGDGQG